MAGGQVWMKNEDLFFKPVARSAKAEHLVRV